MPPKRLDDTENLFPASPPKPSSSKPPSPGVSAGKPVPPQPPSSVKQPGLPGMPPTPKPPGPPIPRTPPTSAATKPPSPRKGPTTPQEIDEDESLDTELQRTGSPIGRNSGKGAVAKRGPSKTTNVDGNRPAIAIEDRANYVAYLEMTAASLRLQWVQKLAENHKTNVDTEALKKVIADLYKVIDGPYLTLGFDKEHNILIGDRMPERRLVD